MMQLCVLVCACMHACIFPCLSVVSVAVRLALCQCGIYGEGRGGVSERGEPLEQLFYSVSMWLCIAHGSQLEHQSSQPCHSNGSGASHCSATSADEILNSEPPNPQLLPPPLVGAGTTATTTSSSAQTSAPSQVPSRPYIPTRVAAARATQPPEAATSSHIQSSTQAPQGAQSAEGL